MHLSKNSHYIAKNDSFCLIGYLVTSKLGFLLTLDNSGKQRRKILLGFNDQTIQDFNFKVLILGTII